jgi:OOP family OmpA-OmpF porin
MNRSTAWCVPLATLALSTAAHAADPGFYFAATASRVEHDVEDRPGLAVLVFSGTPNPQPPFFGGIRPPPSFGVPINPIFPFPPGAPVFIGPTSIDIDEVDAGFSATVGYRINRYLAAELSYHDFGEYQLVEHYSFDDVTYELGISGPSVSVLGSLPLGETWELFLRGGVLFADQEVSLEVNGSLPDQDFSDEVVIAGAGVQWSFAPRWAARLEYQRTDDLKYDNTGESSIDQASLSVLFKL